VVGINLRRTTKVAETKWISPWKTSTTFPVQYGNETTKHKIYVELTHIIGAVGLKFTLVMVVVVVTAAAKAEKSVFLTIVRAFII
jgi:hypothetical protein